MKFISFVGVAVSALTLLAQPSHGTNVKTIEKQLQSKDAAQATAAAEAVARLASEQPDTLAKEFPKWLKPLMDAGQYEVVDHAGLVSILGRPQIASTVADIQAARVEALLALGKSDAALVEAKRYYNVATLKQTKEAIDLVAVALDRARGKQNPQIGVAFRREQIEGGKAPVETASNGVPAYYKAAGQTNLAGNILNSIKLGDAPYAEAIKKKEGDNTYDGLMSRGNLLLLTDRPSEAKECFRKAAEDPTVRGKHLVFAIEGVARAIRAEDGCVGRANAFVRALQESK